MGTVQSTVKIADGEGGFPSGQLANSDQLGTHIASLGDLDGDGIDELGVSAITTDDGATNAGAMYVFFLHQNGTVREFQKISITEGGANVAVRTSNFFGVPGRFDQPNGDQGHLPRLMGGAEGGDMVFVMRVLPNATVVHTQRIDRFNGGVPSGAIASNNNFGQSLASLGDVDGDELNDIMVGAPFDDTGGTNDGALFVLFMRANDRVKSHTRITPDAGSAFASANVGSPM